ncbi:YkvA family protein [Methyloligella sp. 2.7D]|uniref:YkvA family protein n=1 Tax=unclassified Methyloligella TaxID=2625955 RepID=UPI00157DE9B6|nr:YkvA family protein [Methyloligella sp. GL2]QKP76319.1 DUF1232 domain-containing protein [Methyloligella sp. GL2]
MTVFEDAANLRDEARGKLVSSETMARRQDKVRRDLWTKLRRFAGRVPFAEDLVAGYYCALDTETPFRVRAMLFAAIAYFIVPTDFVPDMLFGLGFADDAALLTGVLAMVSSHITPAHRIAAARALEKELPKNGKDGSAT